MADGVVLFLFFVRCTLEVITHFNVALLMAISITLCSYQLLA